MSVICATAGFWAPCTYQYAGDDLQIVAKTFRVRWKRLSKTERKAMDARLVARAALQRLQSGVPTALPDAEIAALREKAITEEQFLAEMLADWELTDACNKPIVFSLKELAETGDQNDGFEEQLFSSYFTTMSALANPKVTEKNSDAPSDTTT